MSYGYLTPAKGFVVEGWFKRSAATSGGTFEVLAAQFTQGIPKWSTTATNGRQLYWGILTASNAFQIEVRLENGTLTYGWTDPSPGGYATDGNWHHWAVRLGTDKRTVTIFLDGQVLNTGTAGADVNWAAGVLSFGGGYAPHLGLYGLHLLNGAMAYLAAANHTLTDARILEHYAAGSGGEVYYGDNEVTRLARIYDWADVPEQSREFDASVTTVQGIQVAEANALDKALDTIDSARGLLFADGQTRMVYHNRRHRYNKWTTATIAESLGSAPEMDITFTADDTYVYNDIRGSRPQGSSLRARNLLSESIYGRKVLPVSLSITSHEELRNVVAWVLAKYGKDQVRISTVTLRGESSAQLEKLTSGLLTIGDVLVIDELPEDAPASTLTYVVDGMGLDADFKTGTWAMSLNLTPNEVNRVFQVGVSTLGTGDSIAL